MNGVRNFLFAALAAASWGAAADWTSGDEKACDLDAAGRFKYYVLSLSWSPEFCRSHPDQINERQCTEKRGFIVHGLWPQCGSDYPQNCKNGGRKDAIDPAKIYAFTPSDFLIDHEWKTHGTCSGLSRSAYFDLAGELFGKLNLPRLSGAPTADKIESLFIENNPGLSADQIYLSCRERGPKSSTQTLDEVRICFDKTSKTFTRCEEDQDSCRNLTRVIVTPAQ